MPDVQPEPLTTMTRDEYHRIRAEAPSPGERSTPAKTRPCENCGAPLPKGKRRYCKDECAEAGAREGARRRAHNQKPATAPPIAAPPATEDPPLPPTVEAPPRASEAPATEPPATEAPAPAEEDPAPLATNDDPPAAEDPAPASNGARRDGIGPLVAELLALPGLGELEVCLNGHRVLVRPR